MTYSLTSQGVADQVAAIYALSDSARLAEAKGIEADFVGWMNVHFTITSAQKAFLSSKQELANLIAQTIRLKGSIAFDYPSPPSPQYSKFVEAESRTKFVADDTGGTVTNELAIAIRYR